MNANYKDRFNKTKQLEGTVKAELQKRNNMKKGHKGKIILKLIGEVLVALLNTIVTLAIVLFIMGYSSMLVWNEIIAPVTGFDLLSFKQAIMLGAYLYILKIFFIKKEVKKDEQ